MVMEIPWGPAGPLSLGTFTGGQLWTEHEGSTAPPFEAKGMDPSGKGNVFTTKGRWHKFDGTNGMVSRH
eukprot:7022845-Prorocentrum_lima.AAC.1